MRFSVATLVIGAAFALVLGAPASNPQETDWLGIISKLKEMKADYAEGYQNLVSIATRENLDVGADIERNLQKSYEEAIGYLDFLMNDARDEMLIPFGTWFWLGLAQGEIYGGWDDIEEDREKLSASAQEELEAALISLLEKAHFAAEHIMELICFENPDSDFTCNLPKSNFNISRKQRHQLKKMMS